MSSHKDKISMPTSWPSIKKAYQPLRDKLLETTMSPKKVTKEEKLEAIDWWIARLNQDKTTISLDEPFVDYPG